MIIYLFSDKEVSTRQMSLLVGYWIQPQDTLVHKPITSVYTKDILYRIIFFLVIAKVSREPRYPIISS